MRSAAPLHITSTPSSRIRVSPFLLSPPAQSLLCDPIDDPVALGAGFRALHDITISRQPGQTALTALRSPPSSVLPTTSTTVFLFNVFVPFFCLLYHSQTSNSNSLFVLYLIEHLAYSRNWNSEFTTVALLCLDASSPLPATRFWLTRAECAKLRRATHLQGLSRASPSD
jgi:hypothetical protein